MSEFEKLEHEAFRLFRLDGDTLGMMAFADKCDEESRGDYASLIRLVCDPPRMYADLKRNDWECVRWHLGTNRLAPGKTDLGGKWGEVFREAARMAWAEVRAIRMELIGKWRWEWGPDGDGPNDEWGFQGFRCVLEQYGRDDANAYGGWRVLDSLGMIDVENAPAGPIVGVLWGTPYGPDPYCRVVMAELAANHVEMPSEFNPPAKKKGRKAKK